MKKSLLAALITVAMSVGFAGTAQANSVCEDDSRVAHMRCQLDKARQGRDMVIKVAAESRQQDATQSDAQIKFQKMEVISVAKALQAAPVQIKLLPPQALPKMKVAKVDTADTKALN